MEWDADDITTATRGQRLSTPRLCCGTQALDLSQPPDQWVPTRAGLVRPGAQLLGIHVFG